jgi:hypothetical protein
MMTLVRCARQKSTLKYVGFHARSKLKGIHGPALFLGGWPMVAARIDTIYSASAVIVGRILICRCVISINCLMWMSIHLRTQVGIVGNDSIGVPASPIMVRAHAPQARAFTTSLMSNKLACLTSCWVGSHPKPGLGISANARQRCDIWCGGWGYWDVVVVMPMFLSVFCVQTFLLGAIDATCACEGKTWSVLCA